MNFAAIGRTEILYNSIIKLIDEGNVLSFIINCRSSPEDKKNEDDFHELACKFSVPYYLINKVNYNKLNEIIEKTGKPKIAISVNYLNVIDQKTIDCFENGILNAHAGDLPKYRGNAPIAWAMLQGENEIGLCVHKMIGSELDSGLIISRSYLKIDDKTEISDVFKWVSSETPNLFAIAIKKLNLNPNYYLEDQKLSKKTVIRGLPRNKEDLRINWNNSAEYIERQIRVSGPPFDGAYFFLNNEKVKVSKAKVRTCDSNYLGYPGQIISRQEKAVTVLTGSGVLDLYSLEKNGKEISAYTLIKSTRIRLK